MKDMNEYYYWVPRGTHVTFERNVEIRTDFGGLHSSSAYPSLAPSASGVCSPTVPLTCRVIRSTLRRFFGASTSARNDSTERRSDTPGRGECGFRALSVAPVVLAVLVAPALRPLCCSRHLSFSTSPGNAGSSASCKVARTPARHRRQRRRTDNCPWEGSLIEMCNHIPGNTWCAESQYPDTGDPPRRSPFPVFLLASIPLLCAPHMKRRLYTRATLGRCWRACACRSAFPFTR